MKVCNNCAAEYPDDVIFCSNCGQKAGQPSAAPNGGQHAPPAGFAAAPQQPQQGGTGQNPYQQPQQGSAGQNPYQQPQYGGAGQNPYQQPQYGGAGQNPYQQPQQGGTGQPPYQQPQQQNELFYSTYEHFSRQKSQKDSPVSMICGIIAIVMSALNFMGIPVVHLAGIVLGIIAITKSKAGVQQKNSQAVTGLVCGIIGLALGVIAIIVGVAAGIMLQMA